MTARKPTRAEPARIPSYPERPPRFDAAGAPCRNAPHLFFQADRERDQDIIVGRISRAKAICARCDRRDACLREALANDEKFGIWGGLTQEERAEMLAARKRTEARVSA